MLEFKKYISSDAARIVDKLYEMLKQLEAAVEAGNLDGTPAMLSNAHDELIALGPLLPTELQGVATVVTNKNKELSQLDNVSIEDLKNYITSITATLSAALQEITADTSANGEVSSGNSLAEEGDLSCVDFLVVFAHD